MTQKKSAGIAGIQRLHGALTEAILGHFFQVRRELGFGYPESVHASAMGVALMQAGFRVQREVPIAVYFRGVEVGFFKADMVVNDVVMLEFKAMRQLSEAFESRLLGYLRSCRLEVAFLLYFNEKAAFKRLIYTNDRKLLPSEGGDP